MIEINTTGNGNSTAFDWQGSGTLQALGSFDGAAVALEVSLDGGNTFASVTDGALTEAGQFNFDVAKSQLRIATTGAGAGTDVTVLIRNFNDLRA